MSKTFAPRMDILPSAQKRIWDELRPAADLGFVLYGGTAIALRLGHRQSVDFDFFSDKKLDRENIFRSFGFMDSVTVLQDEPDALSVLVPYGDSEHTHVKISFFGSQTFGRVGSPEMTSDGVLNVASLLDLMATKVKVVLQRAEAKDYRDIAEMIKAGVSLVDGLGAARTFFGSAFQPSESLKALTYFADGDLKTLTKTEKDILVKAVKTVTKVVPIATVSDSLSDQICKKCNLNPCICEDDQPGGSVFSI